MMGAFEDVLNKAKDVAETVGNKTTEFVEATKLRMQAAEIEKDIASTLEGLGRLVYDGRKAGEDVGALVDDCVAKLDDMNASLKELQDKIDAYANIVRCQTCGIINTDDSLYCKKCGAKLHEEPQNPADTAGTDPSAEA